MADLLNVAESERVAALGGLDARTQSELGQFFTPAAAAQLIASIPRLPESGTLRVLDPGAGSGVLAAALVSRALAERPELSIEVVALDRVHVFDSRSTVFADTGVLQENVIFAGTRGAAPGVVELSVSRDHTDGVSTRAVAYEEVVFPNDPNRFIRLATDAEDTAVAEVTSILHFTRRSEASGFRRSDMIEVPSVELSGRLAHTEGALSLGGIAIMGAGLSISSRFPLTRGLTSLIWDFLDGDLLARSALATVFGRDDKESKALVGDSWADAERAWAAVANNGAARARFQEQFAELVSRSPSLTAYDH